MVIKVESPLLTPAAQTIFDLQGLFTPPQALLPHWNEAWPRGYIALTRQHSWPSPQQHLLASDNHSPCSLPGKGGREGGRTDIAAASLHKMAEAVPSCGRYCAISLAHRQGPPWQWHPPHAAGLSPPTGAGLPRPLIWG